MLVRHGGTYYRVHICRLQSIELQNRKTPLEIPEGNTEPEESDPKINRGEDEHNGVKREDSVGNTEQEIGPSTMNVPKVVESIKESFSIEAHNTDTFKYIGLNIVQKKTGLKLINKIT